MDGEGDGGCGNDGSELRPAGPRKRGISGEKGREIVGVETVETGGRNVLVHSGSVVIKCIVTRPKV